MTGLWLDDDAATLRARGSLKWTGTSGDIAAWVAESDLGTAPAVTAALHAAVDRGLTGYLPPLERREAARACAGMYARRYGCTVPAEQVRLVPDVVQALRLTLDRLTPAGAPIVLPAPAYMPFVAEPEHWGHPVRQVPLATDPDGGPALDLAAIDDSLADGAGLVVLVNPHNPTGRVHPVDELRALAEVVERHGALVFADEIHGPLVHGGRRHVPYSSVSEAAHGHTVTATAASKGWNVAGLKCAQVLIGSETLLADWDAQGDAAEGVSTLGAVAAVAAYDSGEPWLDELCRYVEDSATRLAEVLADAAPAVRYRPPEGTYLAWLDLRDALPDEALALHPGELSSWLRRVSGVTVTDGARCGDVGHGFVRLNLAMPRTLVEAAGRRIAAALTR